MANILIIHGSYGNPQENWFPWLKEKLEKQGHRVEVPQFPIPQKVVENSNHDIKGWFTVFDRYRSFLDASSVIVAHSRGGTFALHALQRLDHPILAAILVGPFLYHWMRKDWTMDDYGNRFPFDWEKIRIAAKTRIVYQSSNDEIPVSEGKEIADCMNAEFVLVENAGHFNIASNMLYTRFDLLLEKIKQIYS